MKTHTITPRSFAGSIIFSVALSAGAHQVSTFVGNGADLQLSEQNNGPSSGTAAELNTRTVTATGDSFRNEVVGLRFDLTGYVLADMTNVSINFVNYRDNSSRVIDVYAVDQGATGGTGNFDTETWTESNLVEWGDFPGLLVTDGVDVNTISIDLTKLTLLEDGQSVGGNEGTIDSASPVELTTYLQGFTGSSSVTFLVTAGNTSGGQYRFGSKDAAGMTSIVGTNGQFAPFLSFDLTTDAPDITPPTVEAVSPTNGAAGVALDAVVEAIFSEAMDQALIDPSTFTLVDAASNPVPASVSYSPVTLTATLIPDAFALQGGTTYTAGILGGTNGVTDEADNPLASDYTWTFTTRELGPDEPIRLTPEADTYIANGTGSGAGADSRQGGSSTVQIRWYDDGTQTRVHIAYIRFDISGIDPALFQTAALSGTFSASPYNGPGAWQVHGLNDDIVSNEFGRLGNDWGEGDISYSNAAGVDNAAAGGTFTFLPAETTFLGTIAVTNYDVQPLPWASTTDELDLSAWLAADTDGLVTVMMISETQDNKEYRIDSKEGNASGGHRPVTLDFFPGEVTKVTGIEVAAGPSIVVSWEARTNHTYGVARTAADLASPNWVDVATNLLGATSNTYTDTAPVEAAVSYRVFDEGAVPPPPPVEYFADDFTANPFVPGGWEVVTNTGHQAGTDWLWGTPPGSMPGPSPDGGGAVGTNLGIGNYTINADISLLSPVIDLTGATSANLTFANFYDVEGFNADVCEIYVRDSAGDPIPALATRIQDYQDFVNDWTTAILALPPEALDRTIRIEFRFFSDFSTVYQGWYIDNVVVTD